MKKKIFIIDCGTYTNEVLVAVNQKYDEIIKYLKEDRQVSDKNVKEFSESKDYIEKTTKSNPGFVIYFDSGFMLLWLKLKRLDWRFYEVLLHECSHIVNFVFREKKINDDEAFAYQLEFIFKTIRQKIHEKNNYNKR